ncbi:hypothetical protein JAAARDRAFT_46540 [Jaapia argillacea MUCL 33604]|uniref:DUF6532 domain-containing protein n=1 Tax=Jaapia argillacea MUCL 33604 TaxID=933084 RepID=A0A067PYC4_9AGAM|nr:hypothetical protein JAAARDRAFT_46540 [Jaapia argillacea MUCL 33604]
MSTRFQQRSESESPTPREQRVSTRQSSTRHVDLRQVSVDIQKEKRKEKERAAAAKRDLERADKAEAARQEKEWQAKQRKIQEQREKLAKSGGAGNGSGDGSGDENGDETAVADPGADDEFQLVLSGEEDNRGRTQRKKRPRADVDSSQTEDDDPNEFQAFVARQFATSSPKKIVPNRLKRRRQSSPAGPPSHRNSSRISSSHPTSPFPPSSLTSPSSAPSQSNGKKEGPNMGEQSPGTRALIKRANTIFHVYVATEEGFPSKDEITTHSKGSFARACAELKRGTYETRLEDATYANAIEKIVGSHTSQLQGEIKTKAQSLVPSAYDISSKADSIEIKKKISALLNKSSFTFSEPVKRVGLYEHPIFAELIAQQWFKKRKRSTQADGLVYPQTFNPIPIPMLALVTTAVECALRDWEDGVFKANVNQFSEDEYRPVYERHLKNLESNKSKAPLFWDKLLRSLFKDAWTHAGNEEIKDTNDGDDYDDVDWAALEANVGS